MSYTTTPNLGLLKPTVGGDDDAWGGHLNANADTLDTQTATKTYTDARRRRLLNAVTTSIPNVGANTSEEVAVVWTLPAGLLANAGDTMHIVVKTDMAGTTDTKVVRLRLTTNSNGLGGTQVASNTCNTATAVNGTCECWIMKTGPNAQRSWNWAINSNNNVFNADATTALTDTGVLYLGLTMQNSTAAAPGSITIYAAIHEFLPAL